MFHVSLYIGKKKKKKENKIIIINCSGNCAIFTLLFDSGLYRDFEYDTGMRLARKMIEDYKQYSIILQFNH